MSQNSLINNGYNLYEKGRYEEALECFEKVLKEHPTNLEALFYKGITLRRLGRYKEAYNCFEKILISDELKIKALCGMGWIDYDLGEYNRAIKFFNEVLELDQNNTYALNGKGYSYLYLGASIKKIECFEKAIECFNKSLMIKPKYNTLALHGKGWAYSNEHNYEKAIECFEGVWNSDPSFYGVVKNMHDYLKNEIKDSSKFNEIFEKLRKIALYIIAFKCNLMVNEKIVHHYTKPEVIKSILESEAHYFRLYNTHYMNDPEEGKTFLRTIPNNALKLKSLQQVYSIKNEDDVDNYEENDDILTFIGSFVFKGEDNLFLWRTYGKDGNKEEAKGVCFDIKRGLFDNIPDHFETLKDKELFCLYNVVYEGDDNYEELKKILLEIDNIANELFKITAKDEKKVVINIIKLLLDEIRYLVKSKHYREEKECRVIKTYNFDMDPYINYIKLDENSTPPKLYVELSKDLTNYIEHIFIGPRTDDYKSWELYIRHYNLINAKNIIISKSGCKFK